MANANWARWFHASVAKYLKEVAQDVNLPVLIEGLDDRSDAFMEATDRVEVRVNGPYSQKLSKGYYRIYIDVNCLFTSRMDGAVKNTWEIDRFMGVFHDAMDGPIPIYRFGTGPEDDSELLTCLKPRPGKNDAIRVIHFGQIHTTDRLREGMVDARYVTHLND